MDNLFEAIKLMFVGMGTVFVALLLIIWLGNRLIDIVNKIAPPEVTAKPAPQAQTIEPNVAAAIGQAVATITAGKAKVEKIEKL